MDAYEGERERGKKRTAKVAEGKRVIDERLWTEEAELYARAREKGERLEGKAKRRCEERR